MTLSPCINITIVMFLVVRYALVDYFVADKFLNLAFISYYYLRTSILIPKNKLNRSAYLYIRPSIFLI